MYQLRSLVISLGALVFACAAKPPAQTRPPVDLAAMREAMTSAQIEEDFASPAAYAHFLAARLAHHEGEHKRAVDELKLALATDEANPYLIVALAEEYARLTELPRAERELEKLLERKPGYYPAQLLMGRVLLEEHHPQRARVHLRKAISLRPSEADAYLVLAQLALEQNQPDEATHAVEELSAALPGEAVGFKRLGIALAERGDFVRARPLLEKAVDRDPGDFEAWVTLAQIYESGGDLERAETAFDRALERDPDNAEVLAAAGRLELRRNLPERAKAYFDRVLLLSDDADAAVKIAFSYLAARQLAQAADTLDVSRKQPGADARLSFYAGLVHEKLNQHPQAAEAYANVPSSSDLFNEARLHQATNLSIAGKHPQALALLEKALSEKPEYVLLYPGYARALERAGRASDAEKFLLKSIGRRSDAEIFEALASLYQRQGRLSQAIDLLVNALAKRPRDEGLLYTLGATYERQGDVDKSLAQMRAVLDVNPDNAQALNFIGYTLADSGKNLEEAEKLLTKALELRPDDGAFLDSLGWLYYRKGDRTRAVSTLERAAAIAPDEAVIMEHLGDAYQLAARRKDAVDAYRRAIDALSGSDEDDAKSERAKLEKKLKQLGTTSR